MSYILQSSCVSVIQVCLPKQMAFFTNSIFFSTSRPLFKPFPLPEMTFSSWKIPIKPSKYHYHILCTALPITWYCHSSLMISVSLMVSGSYKWAQCLSTNQQWKYCLEHPCMGEFISILKRRKLRPQKMKRPSFEMRELGFEPKGLTLVRARPSWKGS